MKPLSADEICGTWATLLLPINADDSIDYQRLSDELDAVSATGVSGVYSNGTAGEFYTQTEAEFDQVSQTLAESCEKTRLPFQIGVSHTSAQIALSRLRRAVTLKPSAVQVILPDWFVLSDDEVLSFLERMAEAAGEVGLILYNPPHAKRVLSGEAMVRLIDRIPNLVGAKVGNVDRAFFEVIQKAPRPFSVFTPGHMLGTHIPMGSKGAYSNLACLSPRGSQRWFEQFDNDLESAQHFAERLIAFFTQHITPLITVEKYANPAVDKLLAAAGGWADIRTRMRWPYRSIPMERAQSIGQLVRSDLPELFQA